MSKTKYFIGCSGWWYKDWVETFYPKTLPESDRLKFYATYFNSTEVNVTFYRLPPRGTIYSWIKRTPDYFIFSVKAPQELTHKLHFLFAPRIFNNFLTTIKPLIDANRLGAILFQAPPEFTKTKSTIQRLEEFLRNLPKEEHEYAIEFRHKSWFDETIAELLLRYNVSPVYIDSPEYYLKFYDLELPFAYIRFHGRGKKVWYYYRYSREQLESFAHMIKKALIPKTKKLYIYFNNHFRGFAPKNAREFIEILGLKREDLDMPPFQMTLH